MRRKRSSESRKTSARSTRKADPIAAAKTPVVVGQSDKRTALVAGVDGLSVGIAGAAIVAAGVLVAAYRPVHPVDAAPRTAAAVHEADPAMVIGAKRGSATPSKTIDEPAATSATAARPSPLTITGCLDRDGDTFRLTDAAGVGIPQSRSWKSGFLKKRASSVTLVDANRHAQLQNHLGQRVTVTDTMVNREMQIGSLRLLSESCSEKTKI